MTSAQWLVLALVLHVVLTFAVGALSLRRRIGAVVGGKVRLADVAVDNSAWPEEARKFGNNFDNQFQTPMLAYAGVACLLATGLADGVSVALMAMFLAGRVLHTWEHTGRNMVRRRLTYFLVSYSAVIALWLWFALRFLVTG